jgi:hypothetical protein
MSRVELGLWTKDVVIPVAESRWDECMERWTVKENVSTREKRM